MAVWLSGRKLHPWPALTGWTSRCRSLHGWRLSILTSPRSVSALGSTFGFFFQTCVPLSMPAWTSCISSTIHLADGTHASKRLSDSPTWVFSCSALGSVQGILPAPATSPLGCPPIFPDQWHWDPHQHRSKHQAHSSWTSDGWCLAPCRKFQSGLSPLRWTFDGGEAVPPIAVLQDLGFHGLYRLDWHTSSRFQLLTARVVAVVLHNGNLKDFTYMPVGSMVFEALQALGMRSIASCMMLLAINGAWMPDCGTVWASMSFRRLVTRLWTFDGLCRLCGAGSSSRAWNFALGWEWFTLAVTF